MKKQLLIISVLVVIVSIFVSCSVNGCRDGACSIRYNSTTSITDCNGTTHYYEPVTDDKGNASTTDKNQGVFAEIETQSNGKAVTTKDGTYVTNEHTTVLPIKDETTKPSNSAEPTTEKSSSDTTKNIEDADNVVDFEPTETTEETKPDNTTTTTEKTTTTTTTETTTQKETQPATDKDGWITKWY